MLAVTIDFNAPDLARRIDQLIQSDLDQLPFGVILLDRKGIVLFYSQTEARQSGYGKLPLGQNFFAWRPAWTTTISVAASRAQEAVPVDLEFGWSGDLADRKRDLRIRRARAACGS